MARDVDREHAELIRRNRVKCPRAVQLSEALFELSHRHGREALETLAIRVDGEFVQKGIEIDETSWGRVFRAAVEALC